MEFINQAVTVLQTLVVALGAGLAVWGVVNLMEGYGNDNPGAKSQGIKQLMEQRVFNKPFEILIRSDGKRHGHKVSQCMHPTSGRRTRHFCHKKETFFFKNQ